MTTESPRQRLQMVVNHLKKGSAPNGLQGALSGLFYDGKSQPGNGPTYDSYDPSRGVRYMQHQSASKEDVEAAIASAHKAFPSWSTTPSIERARILQKAAALLRENNDELARMETLDTGKAFSETSAVDVVTGADVMEYFANLVGGGGLNGETTRLRDSAWVYTSKEPLGPCAAIGAWNYPIQIALWKTAPCLAAGNTLVYKPSEFTSAHGTVLAQILQEAGLPAGVFNVVKGAGDVGAILTSHHLIAKVSFTGQVSTGMKVAGAAAGGMKYVTMELGGKSACIILPGADVAQAVDGAMMANFYSTGQVCTNGTRVFVPKELKADFEKRLLDKMQYIRLGDLQDPNVNYGPLVSETHYKKVLSYIRHGIEQDKSNLIYGGPEKPNNIPSGFESGYWVKPTVFTDCTDDMKIVKEEIFGPVMSILSYDTVDEVIARANNTDLGLAAGVFGSDINLCHKVVSKLEAGITWINSWGESPAEMSVGGWKKSGVGVENGTQGIEAWVRNKSTLVEMGGEVPTVFAPCQND